MVRRLRWWPSVCVVAGLALAGLGAALWLMFRAYGPELTRDRIEAALGNALGSPVRIERVILRPWLGRIVALNLTVRSGVSREGAPFLHLGRAEVTVGISSLWKWEVVLSRIRLQDLTLRVEAAGAVHPVPSPIIPERLEVGPARLHIRVVQLAGGRVIYHEPGDGRLLDIQGIAATARPGGGGMELTLRAAGLRLRAPGLREAAEDLEAEGRVFPDRLTIRKLTAKWQGREIRLSGDVRQLSGTPEVDLRIGGRLDLALLAQRIGTPLAVAGVAEVQGRLVSPRLRGRVSIPELTAGPIRARQVAIRGQWSDGILGLDGISASAFGGKLEAAVLFRPARPAETRATLALRDVSLAALEALVPSPIGLRGTLALEAELAGDPQRIAEVRGHIRLDGSRVQLPGILGRAGLGTVSAEATFAGTKAQLARATGQWPGIRVEAAGPLDARRGPAGLRLLLRADLATLGRLWSAGSIAGEATLSAQANGQWSRPEVTGRASVAKLAVAGAGIDRIEMPFQLADGTLRLESATLTLGRSRAVISGTLSRPGDTSLSVAGLPRNLRLHMELHAPAAHWEDLDPWLPPSLRGSGRFALSGHMEGTPAAWRAAGTLDSARLTAPHGIELEAIRASFTLDPNRVEVNRIRARLYGTPLEGDGVWAWTGTGQATAHVGPVDLSGVPAIPARVGLRGMGRARLQITGHSGAVTATGVVQVERVTIMDLPLGDGSIRLEWHEGEVRADCTFPEARLTGTATGRLDEAGSVTVRLGVQDLALTPILRGTAESASVQLDGTVSGRAEFLVPLRNVSAVQATVTLDPVRLLVGGEAWTNRDPVVLRWTSGTLHVARLILASRVGRVSASGRMTPSGSLDLDVDGRFPLAVLPALWGEVPEAAGILELTARFAGTTDSPTAAGEGRISNGRLELRDFPETLRDLQARFLLSPGACAWSMPRGRLAGVTSRQADR